RRAIAACAASSVDARGGAGPGRRHRPSQPALRAIAAGRSEGRAASPRLLGRRGTATGGACALAFQLAPRIGQRGAGGSAVDDDRRLRARGVRAVGADLPFVGWGNAPAWGRTGSWGAAPAYEVPRPTSP